MEKKEEKEKVKEIVESKDAAELAAEVVKLAEDEKEKARSASKKVFASEAATAPA